MEVLGELAGGAGGAGALAGAFTGGAGGAGGEGRLTGIASGLTGRAGGLAGLAADGAVEFAGAAWALPGTASGLTGRGDELAEDELAGLAAGGVVEFVGAACESTANGTATTGWLTPVGAGDAAEVELLEAVLVSTAAAAAGVAEGEDIEELLEGAAPEMIDWSDMLGSARATEICLRTELNLSTSSGRIS